MTRTVEIDIERLVGATLTALAAAVEPADGTDGTDGTGEAHDGGSARSLVREKLAATAEGREALGEFAARPSQEAARRRLGAALAAAVYADPVFRQALTDELTRTAAAVTPGGAEPSRRFRRGVVIPAVAAALAVALGLTAYGVLGATDEPALKPVTSVEAAETIVPDGTALLVADWDEGFRGVRTQRAPEGSYAPPLHGGVEYLGPEYKVTLDMGFFETVDDAVDAFAHDDMDWMESAGEVTRSRTNPPKAGDEGMARFFSVAGEDQEAAAVVVRVGSVLCRVRSDYASGAADPTAGVHAVARMCAERAEQGQRGQKPDATVRDLA